MSETNFYTSKPFNILWLVLDCARFDRISAHGYERSTTPFLDQLIHEGIDYTHAYSAAIWSLPSYTSLLTGTYPRKHGVNVSGRKLSSHIPTLAQCLASHGYRTACFSNNAWLSPHFGLDRGFQRFDQMWFSAQKSIWDKSKFLADKAWGALKGEMDKGARRTGRRLHKWIKEAPSQPYFAFVSYIEPHAPHALYRKWTSLLARGHNRYRWTEDYSSSMWVKSLPARHEFTEEQLQDINLRYDTEMRYIDNQLEKLFEKLQQDGLLKNTLVIITADHGELLGEHGMLGHQFSVLEPLRHVPLILWGPDILPRGEKVDDLVQTLDIPNTLCRWGGMPWPEDDGQYLLPIKSGEGRRESVITDYPEPYLEAVRRKYPQVDLSAISVGLTAVSDHRYKLVTTSDGKIWGYDLEEDPQEENPIKMEKDAIDPAFMPLYQEWKKYKETIAPETVEAASEVDDDLVDHLRALGYLD